MSTPQALQEKDTAPTRNPGDGPAPHEDLTIAEQLETLRVSGEHRPGEQCFRDPAGVTCWISEHEVKSFLASHGATHSSDYAEAHREDWQHIFFSNSHP